MFGICRSVDDIYTYSGGNKIEWLLKYNQIISLVTKQLVILIIKEWLMIFIK